MLGITRQNDPETLPLVVAIAKSKVPASVRREALDLIEREWDRLSQANPAEAPRVGEVIKKIAEEDKDWDVRHDGFKAALKCVGRDEAMLQWVKSLAESRNTGLESAVVDALAEHWPSHPETVPWLAGRLRDAGKPKRDLRSACYLTLRRIAEVNPNVRPLVLELARTIKDREKREAFLAEYECTLAD
jgi:hypothetical protein